MAGLRERNALQPTISQDRNKNLPYLPHQQEDAYHPNNAPQSSAKKMRGNYIPPSGSAVEGDSSYTTLPNMPAYSQDYPTYQPAAPQSVAPSETSSEKRGFRKLIKRRPVPAQ